MPKLKTRKSIAKRIRFTATGRMKRRSAFRSHILTKKKSSRKRRLRIGNIVNSSDEKRLRKIIPKVYR